MTRSTKKKPLKKKGRTPSGYDAVLKDLVSLLNEARSSVVRSANAVMTATYWFIGQRIIEHEQNGKARAEYGKQLLKRLSEDLTSRFGRGLSPDRLETMRLFYLVYSYDKISATVSRKLESKKSAMVLRNLDFEILTRRFPLSWSHYVLLVRRVDSDEARDFYETEALRSGWSVRQLNRQIDSQFYQRTLLSRNKAALLKKGKISKPEDAMSPEEEIKDPYILEFLGLKDEYSEGDLEDALISKLESFLLELGGDFTFVGRQRRLRIGDEWYRVDLVFFHRRLRCLIIIDLKLGKFTHADAGQMHLYLNYAREHWMLPDENPPVGLILCAQKNAAVAHYALDGLPNKVMAAEYKTALPDEKLLASEVRRTRRLLEARSRSKDNK